MLLAALLLACSEEVTVISDDGRTVLINCQSVHNGIYVDQDIMPCLRKVCPEGLVVLPASEPRSSSVAQCLSAKPRQP